MAVVGAVLVLVATGTAYAAAPQVTDVQDDAYEGSFGVPNPLLSDPAFDITAVEWAKTGRHELTVSMTIKGTPQPGVNYYPYAKIGEDYIAYWIFRVGSTAKYNIFVDEIDPVTGVREHVSTTSGGAVQVSGDTISATFSTHRNRLPATLRENKVLGPFGGLTCVAPEDCSSTRTYDAARSADDARLSLA